ncbi:MAG: ParB/RepB/Spo0J family partition protein [Saprospiraceae bacterium]
MDQKKEMGKGIRALLGNMETSKSVPGALAAIQTIPLKYIEANPAQPRVEFDQESLEELAATIKTLGIIQPITVRKINDQRYQLISGERRTRAARLAGLLEIPTYIRTADDQGMLEMALIENIQRENLNAIEVGISMARLIEECKLTHEDMSKRIGKNRSTVTNYLRLLKLPPDVQQSVKNKTLSMGHARALAGIENLVLQIKLFKETLLREWSVRQLEQTIKSYTSKNKKAPLEDLKRSNEDGNLRKYVSQSNALFGRKTSIKANQKGAGQIIIPFGNYADLEELLERLS